MYFILLIAIYAIVSRHLPITSEIALTGTRARTFGVLLLLFTWPLLTAIDRGLAMVLPPGVRSGVMFPILSLMVFGAIVLVLAYRFRDPPAVGGRSLAGRGTKGEV
jgi:hypothetical protein